MKSSIICTDLETTSDATILTGHSFSKQMGIKPTLFFIDVVSSRLETLFHPTQIQTTYVHDPIWSQSIESTVLMRAAAQLQRLNLKKEDFHFECFEGPISNGIHHLELEHQNVDYLFVGATHHGKIRRLFLNTFVEKTFFKLQKETFVVKEDAHSIDQVVYLIPYAPLNLEDLDKVALIAKRSRAPVHLDCIVPVDFIGFSLEAFDDEPSAKELMFDEISTYHKNAELQLVKAKEYLHERGIDSSYDLKMVLNKTPGETMRKYLHPARNELVVLKPQHHLFNRLSVGSTTLDIMRHVQNNILMLSSHK